MGENHIEFRRKGSQMSEKKKTFQQVTCKIKRKDGQITTF